MRKTITIVGGGACALMLGCELDPEKFDVAVYEKNAAPGRKFLVAGDGGLNLTHSEHRDAFIQRYTPPAFMKAAFDNFSNTAFTGWLNALGIETFVGSSGRIFPAKGIKPIAVLNAFLDKMKRNNVSLHTRHEWLGFSDNNALIFKNDNGMKEIKSDLVIFCMGGASWPVTGSSGDWSAHFIKKQVQVNPFAASNCAFRVLWDQPLISSIEGKVLKNCSISCSGKTHFGEVVLTKYGIEGSGIYPLSPQIRAMLEAGPKAGISIDLKPAVSQETLLRKLSSGKAKTNFTAHVKTQLNLSDVQLKLLKHLVSREDFMNAEKLCEHIKNLKIDITGMGPVEDAISTVGGIALSETDEHYQLKKIPGCFALGEMLDYDAPTGGYLLQSCFSMGKWLADHLNAN